MFKAPEWEDDVPKTHTSFLKTYKKNVKKDKGPAETKITLKAKKYKSKKLQTPILKQVPNVNKTNENKSTQLKTNILSKVTNEYGKKDSPSIKNSNQLLRKRKLNNQSVNTKNNKSTATPSNEESNFEKLQELQNFDEILLNVKKKKFNEIIENDDKEELLFFENKSMKKKKKMNKDTSKNGLSTEIPVNSKKNKLKAILESQSNRRHINISNKSSQLRERMLERLKAAQFRYLNEKLYTSSASEAQQLFQNDPSAFETYHQGYQLQLKKWPVNPLDIIVKKIMKMPKSHLVVDMGCGEASLSRRIPQTVRSFDLVATTPGVEACDMARTPLLTSSVDVAVYCLALMGTELTQYLLEANRVLKIGGHLLVAEVESRFDNVENFTKDVERLGFKLKQLDKSNKVFFFMQFIKIRDPPVKKSKLPVLTLKPCLYKKR